MLHVTTPQSPYGQQNITPPPPQAYRPAAPGQPAYDRAGYPQQQYGQQAHGRHGQDPQQPGRFSPPPQQWGPPAQHHSYSPQLPSPVGRAPAPAASVPPAPRNGLGIAALCLGIVGMLFGLVPFTGFVAFALGAVGIILGLVGFSRARKRTATNLKTALAGTILSALAIGLGIWGMVIVFTGLNQLATDLNNIPSASAPAGVGDGTALPADITTPAVTGPRTYQLEVTGDAPKMMISYGTDSAMSSGSDYQSLPWRKTVETSGDYAFASVSAVSSGAGSITCTITDTATGQVMATKTAKSLDDSEFASANVSCNSMGY